ncbi:hypothetical protein COOONC_06252 [Cooperia oncophora]
MKTMSNRISPPLDVCPVSSESSTSPVRIPRKSAGAAHADKKAKKKVPSRITIWMVLQATLSMKHVSVMFVAWVFFLFSGRKAHITL